jgi:choline-sulfatase
MIMTDQQRWDAMGCSGGWVDTPNMDRIAAEGVRFTNAYTNSPVCVPARASLASGLYPHNHGVWRHERYTLPPEQPTWMAAVRDAGYSTAVIGKTHLHPHSGDLRDREDLLHAYGLDHVDEIAGPRATAACRSYMTDRWEEAGVYEAYKRDMKDRYENKPWVVRPSVVPLELYADVYVGEQAVSYLRDYSGAKPWFCWISFGGPHEPWDTPEPYATRYDADAMPPPVVPEEDRPERPRGVLDNRRTKHTIPFEPGEVGRLRADYAGNLSLIDDQIGNVLRTVEERGELDDTLIAFVSDHGEMNGDYGLIYKQNFLDPAARVPFIIRAASGSPGERGAVTETMVELMDLGPTLIEAAGGRQLKGSFARSLLPVVEDPSQTHRSLALSEFRREVMAATPDWKLGVNRADEPYLLFDRRNDPTEACNLAGLPEFADIQDRLHMQMREAVDGAARPTRPTRQRWWRR